MKLNTVKLLAALAAVLVMFGSEAFMPSNPGCGNDFFITTAFAQTSAPVAGGGSGATHKESPKTPGDYWGMMGFTKWPLLGSLIWVTALVIELMIRGRVKSLCPTNAVAQLSSIIAVKDYVKAWQFCIDNPSALTRTMAPAIEKIQQGAAKAADAAMDYMNFKNNVFKVKCSYLNLNAIVNPLIGLLGTISGMISAFMAYAGATGGDPAKLTGSIGEALLCTWTGLGIAILSLYSFYVLTNRTKSAMTGMQNIVMRLIGEIDFASVTPDMEIIPAEMKARAMGNGKGATAMTNNTAPKVAETALCPHCQNEVQAGVTICPKCNSELEWE